MCGKGLWAREVAEVREYDQAESNERNEEGYLRKDREIKREGDWRRSGRKTKALITT